MHSGTFWNFLHAFFNILEHFACILEHSGTFCMVSGTFWNFLQHSGTFCMHSVTFWNILHSFWDILHAFWNILEHSAIILRKLRTQPVIGCMAVIRLCHSFKSLYKYTQFTLAFGVVTTLQVYVVQS